jgi:UDP-2,4-diacetamido-2,4,6-trideoxy-beta-L-altropyranose hydrolase
MKVLFRTDTSLEIGFGHVMRCLTLAAALRDRGAECHFVCRAHRGNLSDLISKYGFRVHLLPNVANDQLDHLGESDGSLYAQWLGASQHQDAEATIQCVADAPVDWVVIDHYGIDKEWEQALRPLTKKILVIDDLANRAHDCDVLLDQNLVDNYESRYDDLVPEYCVRLLGPDYAMLQPEYAELHPRTPPRISPVSRILVYFGGADVNNLTGLALEALGDPVFANLNIDVVVNPKCSHHETIREVALNRSRVQIHENLPSLASLIVKADLAIGATGATSWERCCLGLPAIVVTLAENQVAIASELSKQDLVTWLGDQQSLSVDRLREAILDEIGNGERLSRRSKKCLELVDGNGVRRVAELIMLNAEARLIARPAVLSDEWLLLGWANEPLVRKNSFNPDAIDPASHRNWFFSRLRNPDHCQIYIVESDRGVPLGQVRFEKGDNSWELHYSLASHARGRGLGTRFLRCALDAFRKSHKGVLVFGQVKADNKASQRVFEALDFAQEPKVGGGLVYCVLL